MVRNLLNEGGNVNVYLTRDAIEADLPVQALQPTTSDPITISLKGLPTSFTGYANKVIKVKTDETGLEYAVDSDTTLWTEAGSNIYPKNVGQVIVNTTTNTDNRKLLINGDAEITTQLYLSGSASTIQIDNSSSQGIYFKNQTSQGFKLFANNGNNGSPVINNESLLGWLLKIEGVGADYHIFKKGSYELYSDSASTDTITQYFIKSSNTSIGNYINNDFTNNKFQIRNFTSTTDDMFLEYDITNEKLTTPSQLLLTKATNQISNGTYNYTLPSSSGTLQLTTDPTNTTTNESFGTLVQTGNTIKLGNAEGNSYTSNLELYFNSTLKLFNTSNVEVAKFTVSSNTANLTLNGGVMTTATFSTNCVWNGGTIGIGYGGTNLSSLSGQAGKILQVNSSANGYDLITLPNSSLWTSSAGTLSVLSSYTKLDLDTNITYNLLNTDVRVKPTSLSEGQLISYDSGLGGGNGSMIFGSNSTSASSGWDTGIYAKQFIKLKCASTEIAEFSVSPASVKTIKLLGDIDALSVRATGGDTVIDYTVNSFSDDVVFNIKEPNAPRQFKIRSNPYDPVYEMTHISSIGTVSPIFKYYLPGGTETINLTPIVKFEGQYLLNNSNDVIYWPLSAGTLALNVNTARLGSFGSFGCVYDPLNVTTPSASNSAFIFATNGTVTRMNCRVDGGTSNHGFDFAGNNVFRFDSNGTINVRNSGQSMYAFNTPNTSGTLGLADDIHWTKSGSTISPKSVFDDLNINGTFTSSSSRFRTNYSSSRCFLTNPSGTNTGVSFAGSFLAYHDNGTELHLNNPSSSSATSTSSNINFKYNGINRIQMTGSETEAMRFLRNNGGGQYAVMGRASTFPSNMSYWSSKSVPGGQAFYIGGTNSNDDGEGYFLTMNGNQMGISSPGDSGALNYYDEDGGSMAWQITQAGSLDTFSDIRLKKDIKHYKNIGFEKYKQIRTVTYRQKIPKNINPNRLKKQSCIDKFNNLQYGIIAQEIYELYPELESSECIREREVFYNRKDNWNNGVYEKEHSEWVKQKEEYECSTKQDDGSCCEYKEPEPPKEFNEEEPIKRFDYHRLNILTVGVVQDLIKENETLKNELTLIKELLTKNNIV